MSIPSFRPSQPFPRWMALVVSLAVATVVMLLATRSEAQSAAPTITIQTEPPGLRHAVGEIIQFQVDVTGEEGHPWAAGSLTYTLSDDGYAPLEEETLGLTGDPLFLSGKLERPGFLRCEVEVIHPGGEVLARAVAAAAVEPENLSPSREAPVDFDDFWSEQKQRLASVPIEAEMVAVSDAGEVELFDLKVRTHEEWPVSGYFARPRSEPGQRLPAVLWTHGAGVRSASTERATEGAKQGFLSLDINAHGIPNGKPEAFYEALTDEGGRLHRYASQGRENRDGVYFRGMFLRVVRALDFLCAQPEWDGQVLAVIGHSQGGAQALVAGGLDSRVTFVGAGVPALCDHTGRLRRRTSGWPKLVPALTDGRPDPVIAEVARYYDVVNFAARCHADTIVSVGFVDRVCPPTSCYVAFNQIPGSLEILPEPEMGHAAPREIQDRFWQALDQHRQERLREAEAAD